MVKSQKRTNAKSVLPKVKYKKQEGKMSYGFSYNLTDEMSEEERVESFSQMLGQLTEDELADLFERCGDIIEAVEKRLAKGGVFYIE